MTEVRYSIKDLENFTTIKAHTIRIWEQRYKLLTPKRTETNIRYYSENDLKKILNINLLYTNGLKISKIAALSETQIIDQAKEIIEKSTSSFHSELDDLIVATLDFDKKEVRRILDKSFEELGLLPMYMSIIVPLLRKIGELWQVNSIEVIHEHFFSSLYRGFLLAKIDHLPDTTNDDKKALLFLHDKEEHEFSLLLYHFLLKENGYHCIYLGQNLPVKDLHIAYEKVQPDVIASTFISQITEKEFLIVIDILKAFSKKSKVVISGMQAELFKKELPKGIELITSTEQLMKIIS